MSKSTALIPIHERSVVFYEDRIVAVEVVGPEGQPEIFVPVRPLCEFLGLNWSAQFRRIQRDAVLSGSARSVLLSPSQTRQGAGVAIMATPPPGAAEGAAAPQEMVCLPLTMLHGWLFGIQASRVKPEYRDAIVRYQREVYQVLWRAFRPDRTAEFEARLVGVEDVGRDNSARLDQAAAVVGDIRKRLSVVEERVAPGQPITAEQAGELSQAVKALAMLLTEADPTKNHFQGVWSEVNRRMGVASYKNIPASRYREVMAFLEDWRASLSGSPTD